MVSILDSESYKEQLIDLGQSLPAFNGSLLIFFLVSGNKEQLLKSLIISRGMGKLVVIFLPSYFISTTEELDYLLCLSNTLVLVNDEDPIKARKLVREAAMALYCMSSPVEEAVGPQDPHFIQYLLINGGQGYFASFFARGESIVMNIINQVDSFMCEKIRKVKRSIIDILVIR